VEIELERILLKMACHGMVRANQRLTREEMQALLETLDKTPFSSNCPHGRPTYLRWTLGELERLFKRA
jgi:DNA mismatch repair protein MutL